MINNFKEFAITNKENVIGGGRQERIAARKAARIAARKAARESEIIEVDITVIDYAPISEENEVMPVDAIITLHYDQVFY